MAWSAAASLWLLPLLAMQFTDEVNWSGFDFVIFGAMLALAGGMLELAVRITDSVPYRAAAAVAVITAFMLMWINGAVGIIGSENNPANLLYVGVLATALGGTILARSRPRGMMLAMIATAAIQALVPLIAFVALPDASSSLPDVVLLTTFFCGLWLVSAALFRASDARDD